MRTKVTGSSGFVGQLLCNVLSIPKADQYDIVNGPTQDVTNEHVTDSVCQQADTIVHLAAISGLKACADDEAKSYAINTDATIRLAEKAKSNGVHRFIFPSSSAVYGEAQSYGMDESHPCDPRSVYGKQKLEAESILDLASPSFEVIILRKSNLYGWGMTWKGITVIDKFIEAVTKREPMKLVGTGSQKRDFLHILDAVSVYSTIVRAKRVRSGVYNLGGQTPMSVRAIAELVNDSASKILGWRSPIEFIPDDGAPLFHDFVYDSSKARCEWQYSPTMSIEFYIKERLLDYLRTCYA